MPFNNADIAIGQLWRSLTHVKYFRNACTNPRQAQTQKLLQIVRTNEKTAFGRKYNFDRVKSVSDFQRYVPVSNYEDLQPYIEKMLLGEGNQLTAQAPFMYATTSGTTAKPKFIPINGQHLRDYTHAFQIHNYHLIGDNYQHADGRYLIITSNDEQGRVPSGLPYGAVSGLLHRRQPPIIRRHFATPYELCKVGNVDTKYYLMLRCALIRDVIAVLACNPSSMLLLADQLKEHVEDLIADIFDGTIKSTYTPPAAIRHAFDSYIKPNRERARELERILSRDGVLKPDNVWPRLCVLSCWKGGPMSFYLERLPEAYGPVPVRDFGYMASEGRGSIPISDDGAGGVSAITSHFFEYVPEEEIDSPDKRFLTVDQLELNRRYYIYFTTSAGLYRYNINDLIQVSGFYENTPIIEFVRKGLGVSSITGEKLTEEQVLTAVNQVVRHLNLDSICHFTAEVELGMPPHYVCFVEANSPLPNSVQDEFVRLFDQSLRIQNSEYEDKRETKRLGMPSLRVLPTGTYTRLRQQRVTEGAPEAQVKIPLLTSPQTFAGRLALLGVS
jgi:GH3 auxin-responsive promoter